MREVDRKQVEAAGAALATELEFSCPTRMDGDAGWYAVAERVLLAGDAATEKPPPRPADGG